MRPVVFILLLVFTLPGCGRKEQPSLTQLRRNAPIQKVQVFTDDSIFVDHNAASLDTLDTQFNKLAEAHGMVWYFRENPGERPSAQARSLLDLMLDHELAICLSNQPDYIDITERISQPKDSSPRDTTAPSPG